MFRRIFNKGMFSLESQNQNGSQWQNTKTIGYQPISNFHSHFCTGDKLHLISEYLLKSLTQVNIKGRAGSVTPVSRYRDQFTSTQL